MTTQKTITDEQFQRQFENCTLAPEYFDHRGHIRLCWIYLQQHSTFETARLMSNGIKRFAESLGDAEKYSVTLTHAMVQLIGQRISVSDTSWQHFLETNPELLGSWRELLGQYYTHQQLFGLNAKKNYLPPDRQPW